MRNAIDIYYRFLKLLLTVMMAVLMVPVTLQIVARYIGIIPRYIWTEEMARFCFIWILLIGARIAVRDGSHFLVDRLPEPRTKRGTAIGRIFVDAIILVVAIIFVVWGWPLVQFGLLQQSEMAGLPMVLIYAAWPIAGVTWMLFLGERMVDHLKLFRSG